jgi:YggT family protein
MLCTGSTKLTLESRPSIRKRQATTTRKCVVASSSNNPSFWKNNVAPRGLMRCVWNVKSVLASMAQRTIQDVDAEDLNSQIKQSVKSMRMLAMVVPFAAVSGSTDTFFIITKAVASFIKLYLLLLFVRVLLSWFPTFTWWEQQPWLALRQVTDPYLKLFSGLVPPLLGTIDLTPLFGFFILQFLGGALDVADDETRFWS